MPQRIDAKSALRRLLAEIFFGFCRLSRRQFEAPWRARDTRPC